MFSNLLLSVLLDDDASVVSAKAEGVVDGRRHDVVLYTQHADHALYGTCGTEEVAGHALGRADVDLVSLLAEEILDGLGLRDVAYVSVSSTLMPASSRAAFMTSLAPSPSG